MTEVHLDPTLDASADDPRVLAVARAYLADLEAGRKPARERYLAAHPDLVEVLTECFAGIDLAHTAGLALAPSPTLSASEFPTNPLGDFQIVRELGRGGMGVVYEAVQLSLGRRVALKVLPFAAGLDGKQLQRFKTEAHAAAQLHHSNIVPVYAVGCERGVHFYAMQLIEGRPLAEVIRELKGEPVGDASRPKSGLSTLDYPAGGAPPSTPASSPPATLTATATASPTLRPQASYRLAAKLIAQVADALEYAHEVGVIHRDIKPANLLLDGKGTIWVTDFGLAQVAAEVSLTQTGDMLGTLRYMSPEQAAGRRVLVDQRTDVYSLGATLYELLTLQPLFTGQDRQTLLHQILHEEPTPPCQVVRTIPFELETIVLKAVAKLPGERYNTAGEFAADLRRFLEERPILARRPSLHERARKWMRRHPTYVGSAVVLLVFGLIGLGIATALILQEQARTTKALSAEQARAQEAETRFQLARRAADDMIQLAEEELADLPFQENLRKRLLETAYDYYEEFIAVRQADPSAQAELAFTRDRVKRILEELALLQTDRQRYLLREPAVLADLKISDEVKQELVQVVRQHEAKRDEIFRELPNLGLPERRQRILEQARANETLLAKLLTPTQVKRLRQIALQCQGVLALRDPQVAKELKLTTEQKQTLRSWESVYAGPRPTERGGPPERGERGGPPERGERGRHAHEHRQRWAQEKLVALLTTDQLKLWQDLTGEPYLGPWPNAPFTGPGFETGPFGRPR